MALCGKTGSGKTSLIKSLFKLYEGEGDIYVDDVEIKSIGVRDLRKKITIISQVRKQN